MTNPISVQAIEFLYSAVLGILLGILYDIIRLFRSYTSGGRIITALFDFIFWLLATTALLMFVLVYCGGRMRWYVLFGAFCGGFVYVSAFGEIVYGILRALVTITRKILNTVTKPLYFLLRTVWRKGRSAGRSAEKKLSAKRKLRRVKKERMRSGKAGKDGKRQKTQEA